MANYTTTKYVIKGNIDTLKKLRDAIVDVCTENEKNKNYDLNLSDIYIKLGLYTKEELLRVTKNYEKEKTPEGLGISGSWYGAKLIEKEGETLLFFAEDYKWEAGLNLEILSELPLFSDQITAIISMVSSTDDCDYFVHIYGDRDNKYFTKSLFCQLETPTNGTIDIECTTEEEACQFFKKYYPEVSEDADWYDIIDYAEENDIMFFYTWGGKCLI